MRNYLVCLLLLLLSAPVKTPAQKNSDKEKAKSIASDAIKKVDKGDVDDGILLLKQSAKLDPDNYVYPYEIAYAYYQVKDYSNALAYTKEVMGYKNTSDLCYELLGNIYDYMKDSVNCLKAYDVGLKKFPNSGRLYLEIGVHYALAGHYEEALGYYEKGIEVDPEFPSNYYRAAQLFLLYTSEQIWGMIYGELFLNLERSGDRNEDVSKMLYETYKKQIQRENDTSYNVSFTKNGDTLYVDELLKKHPVLPFSVGVYEPLLALGVSFTKNGELDLEGMCKMRAFFIKSYYEKEFNKKYPIVLFEYQNKIEEAGHFNAYSHWVLANGDVDAFLKWKDANADEWKAFIEWYRDNPIKINRKNEFLRTDYR